MLKFWEDTRLRRYHYYVMITSEGIFKGDIGDTWHIMSKVDIAKYIIEIMKWVGICLYVLV